MTILIADFARVLTAAPRAYLLPAEDTVNVAIANNNNGAAVTVTVTVTDAEGTSDPAVLTLSPYVAEFLQGVIMKGMIVAGNGANVTVLITTKEEIIRVEPITVGQRVSPVVSDPRFLALYENRYFAAQIFAQAPALATQRVLFRLRNPPNTATNLVITLVRVVCNAARGFWIATNNPTAGLLNPQVRINKAAAASGLSTSKGLPSFNNNLAADPSNVIHHETLQANVPTEYREPLLIKPGTGTDPVAAGAIDIQVGDASDATTDLMTVEIEWYEEPAL